MQYGIPKFVDSKDKLHEGDCSMLSNIDDEYKSLLTKMLAKDAYSRPSITELIKIMA